MHVGLGAAVIHLGLNGLLLLSRHHVSAVDAEAGQIHLLCRVGHGGDIDVVSVIGP